MTQTQVHLILKLSLLSPTDHKDSRLKSIFKTEFVHLWPGQNGMVSPCPFLHSKYDHKQCK